MRNGLGLRGVLRAAGALLIVAGVLVMAYSGYAYVSATLAEREAEAHIPGQVAEGASSAPTVLPAFQEPSAMPTRSGEAIPTARPTAVPFPADPSGSAEANGSKRSTEDFRLPTVAQSTNTGPRETTTLGRSVGAQGLARGDGADPTRLIIPRLKLDTRVDEATWAIVNENGTDAPEWQIPFDAVGHLSTTAKPGEAGNAVISGHQNLIGPNKFGLGKFAGLWNLQKGDPFYVFDRIGRIFQFRVAASYFLKEEGEPLEVREQHAQQILRDDGTPIVTFETCWNGPQAPLSGNTYRWIVVANLTGSVDSSTVPDIGNVNPAGSGMGLVQ